MNWYALSLFAAAFLAANVLLLKKATMLGVPVAVVTVCMWCLSGALLLAYLLLAKQLPHAYSGAALAATLFASLAFLAGAFLLNTAIAAAPNPGYATAVGSLQVLLVLLMSAVLFNSSFTLAKVAGAMLVVGGVVLLGLQ